MLLRMGEEVCHKSSSHGPRPAAMRPPPRAKRIHRFFQPSSPAQEAGAVINPTSQMRKLRHRQAKTLAQVHAAAERKPPKPGPPV